MTDNTTLPGTGDVIAADDISGVKHQLVKVEWGPADTANSVDTATGKPLPVQVRSATGLIPIGEPTDAAATATDTTSVSGISIWKQISASIQILAGAVGSSKVATKAAAADFADGSIATLGLKADAKSTATDTTSVTAMSVLKQISASIQAAASSLAGTLTVASHAVTNAGTFAVQATLAAGATNIAKAEDVASADADVGVPAMGVRKATPANSSGTDGDYEMLQMSAGRLWTNSLVGDGTNAVAVKAASTAPTATDPAFVVAISPNSVNPNGTTTDSASAPVAFSTEGKAQLGSLTETAPASDTASSGLNGRLQRIAQRITSLIALLPTALGGSGGLKVDDIFGQYETVAASQTAQALGATGATGDYLAYVEVFPGAAACGVVTILDNATTWGTFAGGGTTALPSLVPFRIDVGAYSASGAWKITTGANVTAVGVGKFT